MNRSFLKKIILAVAWSTVLPWTATLASPSFLSSLFSGNSNTIIDNVYQNAKSRMDGYIFSGPISTSLDSNANDIQKLLFDRALAERDMVKEISLAVTQGGNQLIGIKDHQKANICQRFFHWATNNRWNFDHSINTINKKPILSELDSVLKPSIVNGNATIETLAKQIETIQGTIVSKDLIGKALEQYKANVNGTYYYIKNNWYELQDILKHGGPQNEYEKTLANGLVELAQKSEYELKQAISTASGKTLTAEDFNKLFPNVAGDKELITKLQNQLQPSTFTTTTTNFLSSCYQALHNHVCHPILSWKSWYETYRNSTITVTTFAGLFTLYALYKLYRLYKTQPAVRGNNQPGFWGKAIRTTLYGAGLTLTVPTLVGAVGSCIQR